jgi:hypothetical protein
VFLYSSGYAANCRHRRDENEDSIKNDIKVYDKKIELERSGLNKENKKHQILRKRLLKLGLR